MNAWYHQVRSRYSGWVQLYFGAFFFTLPLYLRAPTNIASKLVTDRFDTHIIMHLFFWVSCVGISLMLPALYRDMRDAIYVALCMLLGVLLTSCIYAPFPIKSFLAMVSLISAFMACIVCRARLSETGFVRLLIYVLSIFQLLSAAAYVAMPGYARTLAWNGAPTLRMSGMSGDANALAPHAVLLILLLVMYGRRLGLPRWFWSCSLGLASANLLLTQSRTSVMALAIGLLTYWLSKSARRFWTGLPFVLLSSVIVFIVVSSVDLSFLSRAESGDITTGRSQIWQFVWTMIQARPLFGYGYNSSYFIFLSDAARMTTQTGMYIFPHAHNLYLQMLFSGGALSLGCLLALLILVLVRSIRSGNRPATALLATYVALTFTESAGFFQYADILLMLLAVTVALAMRGSNTVASQIRKPLNLQRPFSILPRY